MSAPMLSASEQQASLRANLPKSGKVKQTKKKLTIKHVLISPYNINWPNLENEVEVLILDKLKENLQKFAMPKEKAGRKRKDLVDSTVQQKKNILRSQIVFGVNSVTKELEKDNLQLVVTCKSANPPILTKHLIGLSETRKCLAICLNGLNKVLSDTVDMGSIAIGFKKLADENDSEAQDFKEFISYVKSVAPLKNTKCDDVTQDDDVDKEVLQEVKRNESQSDNNGDNPCLKNKEDNLKPSQISTNSTDYSRFYIYKQDMDNNSLSSKTNFITVVSDDAYESEPHNPQNIKTTRKRKHFESDDETTGYLSVNVRKMKGNENKKKKMKMKKINVSK